MSKTLFSKAPINFSKFITSIKTINVFTNSNKTDSTLLRVTIHFAHRGCLGK